MPAPLCFFNSHHTQINRWGVDTFKLFRVIGMILRDSFHRIPNYPIPALRTYWTLHVPILQQYRSHVLNPPEAALSSGHL